MLLLLLLLFVLEILDTFLIVETDLNMSCTLMMKQSTIHKLEHTVVITFVQ